VRDIVATEAQQCDLRGCRRVVHLTSGGSTSTVECEGQAAALCDQLLARQRQRQLR
jgi:hypothetical protein